MKYTDMKLQYICTFITLICLLTGCSLTDIQEDGMEKGKGIYFSTYTGVQTKGTEVTQGTMESSGFGIMAYLTQGDYSTNYTGRYIDNELVEWNGTKWTYSPTRYWPNNGVDKLSFFAYAPYDEDGTKGIAINDGTGKDPQLDFTLQTPKEQIDLVVAASKNLKAGTVNLSFQHVLTGVKLYAKPSDDLSANKQVSLYVTGIKLLHSDKLAKQSQLNMVTSTWAATPQSYLDATYDLGAATGGILNFTTTDVKGNPAIKIANKTTPVSLFDTGEALYLIPINGKTGCANGDVQIAVSYELVTRSTDLGNGGDNVYTISSITKNVSLPEKGFMQNTTHSYTLTLGLNEVTVNVATQKGIIYDIEISTAQDLADFRDRVNAGEATLNAKQVADIDLATLTNGDQNNWTPINNFAGVYNGNGYSISNLKVSRPESGNVGLILTATSTSILTGIKLINATISTGSDSSTQGGNSGALVATAQGIVSHCTSTGSVTGYALNAGGLIGQVTSTGNISLCSSSATVKNLLPTTGGSGTTPTVIAYNNGGLIGLNDGIVVACCATGAVNGARHLGSNYKTLGGFAGRNNGKIYGCYSTGRVTIDGHKTNIAGFVGGVSASSLIVGCYNTGNGDHLTGGIDCFPAAFTSDVASGSRFINCFARGRGLNVQSPHVWGDFFRMGNVYSNSCTNCYSVSTHSQASPDGNGIIYGANKDLVRSIVSDPYTSEVDIKIPTGGPITGYSADYVTRKWKATDFWSATAGSDDAPDINWDIMENITIL